MREYLCRWALFYSFFASESRAAYLRIISSNVKKIMMNLIVFHRFVAVKATSVELNLVASKS